MNEAFMRRRLTTLNRERTRGATSTVEKTLPFQIPPFAYTLHEFHLAPHYFISPCFRSFSLTLPSHSRASTIIVAPSSSPLPGIQLNFISTNHPFNSLQLSYATFAFWCSCSLKFFRAFSFIVIHVHSCQSGNSCLH